MAMVVVLRARIAHPGPCSSNSYQHEIAAVAEAASQEDLVKHYVRRDWSQSKILLAGAFPAARSRRHPNAHARSACRI